MFRSLRTALAARLRERPGRAHRRLVKRREPQGQRPGTCLGDQVTPRTGECRSAHVTDVNWMIWSGDKVTQ